jgi:hypothetical protein
VDSHRGTAYIVAPYVKQGSVVSTRYSQINMLRTIEDILGTEHINLNTAFQRPMSDVFDMKSSGKWTFAAEASTVLSTATLALGESGRPVTFAAGRVVTPTHDAAYGDAVTAGFDFSEADQVPPAQFNRVLWKGLGREALSRATGTGVWDEGRELAGAEKTTSDWRTWPNRVRQSCEHYGLIFATRVPQFASLVRKQPLPGPFTS